MRAIRIEIDSETVRRFVFPARTDSVGSLACLTVANVESPWFPAGQRSHMCGWGRNAIPTSAQYRSEMTMRQVRHEYQDQLHTRPFRPELPRSKNSRRFGCAAFQVRDTGANVIESPDTVSNPSMRPESRKPPDGMKIMTDASLSTEARRFRYRFETGRIEIK